jgi:Ca-activated chloride channel family protein
MNLKARSSIVLALLFIAVAACGGSYVPDTVAASSDRQIVATPAMAEPPPAALESIEDYAPIGETGFQKTARYPLSTFSVDVDTAAYANVRRFLKQGQRPPADAVRVEELINYFDYEYPVPSGEHPIAIASELTTSPFDDRYQLLRIALSAHDGMEQQDLPKNLVFLIDVSGSMDDENKLPMVKRSLELLIGELDAMDRVAIVVYAGGSGVVLPPTPGSHRSRISMAVNDLEAGGSTNGASGIELAYDLAVENLRPGAINRVILATDGDFNVGVTSREQLLQLIERRRAQGVYLTVLGYGMGNLKDATMEMLADHGNGNYAYIDSLREAHKVLVEEIGSTLNVVAQDAKLQLTWDQEAVIRYHLIGYENRRLRDEDFANDAKDAGDLGAGHHVTALYEIELARDVDVERPLVTIDVRYKRPGEHESRLMRRAVSGAPVAFDDASADMRFATAVASFGLLLRESPFRGELGFAETIRIARGAVGHDPNGYRRELVELVAQAKTLYEN